MSGIATTVARRLWSPYSYTNYKRYIDYFSHEDQVFRYIQTLPPIVSVNRINMLKKQLVDCEEGKKVLFHAGDCAEPFQHVNHAILERSDKVKFFTQCKSIIQESSPKRAVLIGNVCIKFRQLLLIIKGRIAGQYAKPRSSQFTTHNCQTIHNYKGDNVNGFTVQNRQPQHSKLSQGYFNSVATHNYLLEHMNEMFVSHEGLILPYEAALTRQQRGKNYCQSAHMLWIGQRTRQLDGGHVEFFRGINNSIGIKISSNINQNEFIQLVKTLNPQNQKGKLLIIIRMGMQKITHKLQHLIQCKMKHNLNFLFVSDPMHGNTFTSSYGDKLKTRNYHHILHQLMHFRQTMTKYELPSGVSLEATFEDVHECFGGAYPLEENQIKTERYVTKCDPRLNWNQTTKLLHQIYDRQKVKN